MSESTNDDDRALHERFAKQLNGRVWQLLEKGTRSAVEDVEIDSAAHTSLYHWMQIGTGVHHQRGAWMLARVHAVLGNTAEAMRFAGRCLKLTEKHEGLMQDFDHAYAFEGAAKAHVLAGNTKQAQKYMKLAEAAGDTIVDEEDREIFQGDFEAGEWYGLR